MEYRLGDVIDDYCIKCRRLTNHSVVSIVEGDVAKVRCRSCYHEHSYLHEQAPPSRKDLKKAELAAKAEADAAAAGSGAESTTALEDIADSEIPDADALDPETADADVADDESLDTETVDAAKSGSKTRLRKA